MNLCVIRYRGLVLYYKVESPDRMPAARCNGRGFESISSSSSRQVEGAIKINDQVKISNHLRSQARAVKDRMSVG
jgi:hypothetical protein